MILVLSIAPWWQCFQDPKVIRTDFYYQASNSPDYIVQAKIFHEFIECSFAYCYSTHWKWTQCFSEHFNDQAVTIQVQF